MKIGPKFKIARRLGEKIWPKTQTTKFAISGTEKKTVGKGKRGGRGGGTEYGGQLLEKQKAKYTYGVSEKQFRNYVNRIHELKQGTPVGNLFQQLETRLDNVVFRLAWTVSRAAARQAVGHGHIMVNGRRVSIPSYQVRAGDKITIRPGSKDSGSFRDYAERQKGYTFPNWITYDMEAREAIVKAVPTMKDKESTINFDTIIEFYSRV